MAIPKYVCASIYQRYIISTGGGLYQDNPSSKKNIFDKKTGRNLRFFFENKKVVFQIPINFIKNDILNMRPTRGKWLLHWVPTVLTFLRIFLYRNRFLLYTLTGITAFATKKCLRYHFCLKLMGT